MNELLLTVVVPVYNEEEYLQECLRSLINQTFKDFEIILVDDGSTDNSLQICNEFAAKDSRIKVIHQTNQGMIRARYTGVRSAKGKYIIFCDADDFVEKDTYRCLLDKAIKYDVDIVTSGCWRYYGSQKKIIDVCAAVDEGLYSEDEIRKSIIPVMMWERNRERWGIDPSLCMKLIRRELLLMQYEQVCMFNFSFGEDSVVIYPIILKSHKIYISHDCFYYHRQRNNNQIAPYINSVEFLENALELYRYFMKVFSNHIDKDVLMMQLDMFYIRAVKYISLRHPEAQKKNVAPAVSNKKVWIFPFEKVEKHSRVVIHGAGSVGRQLVEQLEISGFCKEILWVDNNPPQDLSDVRKADSIDKSYDYVVIAVENVGIRNEIKQQYLDDGWEENKLVDVDFGRRNIYV